MVADIALTPTEKREVRGVSLDLEEQERELSGFMDFASSAIEEREPWSMEDRGR